MSSDLFEQAMALSDRLWWRMAAISHWESPEYFRMVRIYNRAIRRCKRRVGAA